MKIIVFQQLNVVEIWKSVIKMNEKVWLKWRCLNIEQIDVVEMWKSVIN